MFAKFFNRFLDLIAARVAALLSFDDLCKRIAAHANITRVAEVVCDLLDLSEVEANIAKSVHITASDVADNIEISDVVDALDIEDLADKAAGNIELDYDKVCSSLDLDYSEIASSIDLSDVARELDTSNMEFDYSEIASNLSLSELADEFALDDIGEHINYDKLAKALLAQFAKAQAVAVRPSGT